MPVGIVDSDDHGVGDDALHDLSGLADLHDPAVEGLARKGVHRELRGPVDPDTADVSLVDAHLDLHFRQVSSDGEEGRRRQTRRDRLPDIHRPRHHHAVDRRVDRGVLEIEARLVQRRFLLLHLRAGGLQHRFGDAELCLGGPDGAGERLLLGARSVEHSDGGVIGGLGRVVFALGNQRALEKLCPPAEVTVGVGDRHLRARRLRLALGQRRPRVPHLRPRALDLGLLVEDVRLGRIHVGASLFDLRLEGRGVDPGDHLALTHDGVEIGVEPLDLARDLGADLHRRDGVEVARRRDCGDDRSTLRPLGPVLWGAPLVLRVEVAPDPGSDGDGGQEKRQGLLQQPLTARSFSPQGLSSLHRGPRTIPQ